MATASAAGAAKFDRERAGEYEKQSRIALAGYDAYREIVGGYVGRGPWWERRLRSKRLAGDVGALRGVANNVSNALGAAFASG